MHARIDNGRVAELVNIPEGQTAGQVFHPDLAAQVMEVPAGVAPGWRRDPDTGEFSPPPGPDLEDLRAARLRALAQGVNSFIATKPHGGPRYDGDWKLTALNLKIEYRAALADPATPAEVLPVIQARLDLILSVEAWINKVLTHYLVRQAELNAASDEAGLTAVTWDFSPFEVGQTPDGDPDVYLAQITAG